MLKSEDTWNGLGVPRGMKVNRLKYVDMVRGFAILWMIFVQLLDMFSSSFNMYAEHYEYALKYVNWLPIFLIVSGFSLKLMLDKYDTKTFLRRNILRSLRFIIVGVLLILWCDWKLPTIFDEVVSSIGINVSILSVFLYVFSLSNRLVFLSSLFVFTSCLVGFNSVFYVEGAFNPFWCLAFMAFGAMIASFKDYNWKLLPLFLLLGHFSEIDFFGRTFGFWIVNITFVSLCIGLMQLLERYRVIAGFLGYFGKHSLFFYVLHFAIFQKLLLVTSSYGTFPLGISLLFVILSIFSLICMERFYHFFHLQEKWHSVLRRARLARVDTLTHAVQQHQARLKCARAIFVQNTRKQVFKLMFRHSLLAFREVLKNFKKSPAIITECIAILGLRTYSMTLGLLIGLIFPIDKITDR